MLKVLFWVEKPIGIYPGQYFDEETGLHYNWQRYYDPETGRYTKTDPVGFDGGDTNLYRYALNSPQNLFDQLGLKYAEAYGAAGVVVGGTAALAGSVVLDAATFGVNILATPGEVAAAAAIGGAIGYTAGSIVDYVLNKNKQEPCPSAPPASKPSLDDMKNNPPTHPEYNPPKNWNGAKVKNPNGAGSGWPDRNGDVWVPTDHNGTHGRHYDVQNPRTGRHDPKYY
jgi:RHS repeat-associated protein